MTADDIVKKAKERLAELDAERAKLTAMIAAAEGRPVSVPVPNPLLFIPVMPQRYPWEIDRPWDPLGPVTCGTVLFSDAVDRFVELPFSLEGVRLSAMRLDTHHGFVAGGVCVDTGKVVFRA